MNKKLLQPSQTSIKTQFTEDDNQSQLSDISEFCGSALMQSKQQKVIERKTPKKPKQLLIAKKMDMKALQSKVYKDKNFNFKIHEQNKEEDEEEDELNGNYQTTENFDKNNKSESEIQNRKKSRTMTNFNSILANKNRNILRKNSISTKNLDFFKQINKLPQTTGQKGYLQENDEEDVMVKSDKHSRVQIEDDEIEAIRKANQKGRVRSSMIDFKTNEFYDNDIIIGRKADVSPQKKLKEYSANKLNNTSLQSLGQKTTHTLNEEISPNISPQKQQHHFSNFSHAEKTITEPLDIDKQDREKIFSKSIFLQTELLDGYKDVFDQSQLVKEGTLVKRSIVGTPQMFFNQYRVVNGKDFGFQPQKRKDEYGRKSSSMGTSSILSTAKTQERYQNYRMGVKKSQELKFELKGAQTRIQKNKIEEQRKFNSLSKIQQIHETREERILQKFDKTMQYWDKLEQNLSKKANKTFFQPSTLDISNFRSKMEDRQTKFEQSQADHYVSNAQKWHLGLREDSEKYDIEKKLSQNDEVIYVGAEKKQLTDIITEDSVKKIEHPYNIMADFPQGFYRTTCAPQPKNDTIIRNPLDIKKRNNFNQTQTQSTLNFNKTQYSLFSNATTTSLPKYFSHQPEFEDLMVSGQSQIKREMKMVTSGKDQKFNYKNPKLIQKEHNEQLIMQAEDKDFDLIQYSRKSKGVLAQYSPSKKQQPHKNQKLRNITKFITGFKHAREDDFNMNLREVE